MKKKIAPVRTIADRINSDRASTPVCIVLVWYAGNVFIRLPTYRVTCARPSRRRDAFTIYVYRITRIVSSVFRRGK